ncbi:hypothetical protein OIU79_003941 [Salix purpurea]|uniref:Uncharacterized protein n=1 Tax=Salix purpurea TaxID=77065 RepID=A0A9Q0U968_SALPP|nr:hypothetical protein OIU79_003941 [Salix purpurea]
MSQGSYIHITKDFQIQELQFVANVSRRKPSKQASIKKSTDCKMTNNHIQIVK